jgi:hypothetical protein
MYSYVCMYVCICLSICLSVCMSVCVSVYSCCSHLERMASVKRFVSLQFLNFRESVGHLGWEISPMQGRYLYKHRINANIHASSWIPTHDPSVRECEDILCLTPRGHCDRQYETTGNIILYVFMFVIFYRRLKNKRLRT